MRILNPRPPNGNRSPPPPCSIAYCRLQYRTEFFLKRQIYLLDLFSMCIAPSNTYLRSCLQLIGSYSSLFFIQLLELQTDGIA